MAIDPSLPGGCPSECPTTNPCMPRTLQGHGCQSQCVTTPITALQDDDGCCPRQGLDGYDDNDCGSCGDTLIGPGETCDPPETCPTAEKCAPPDSCIVTTYSGSPETCDASCVPKLVDVCKSGDGCCPSSCDSDLDRDCSDRCGDGRVDREAGETCEPTNTEARCPASCDDADPCTRDLQLGSPEHCNVSCTHTDLGISPNADGCCPAAADTSADPDCKPDCSAAANRDDPACKSTAPAAASGTDKSSAASPAAPASRNQQCSDFVKGGDTGLSAACSLCACSVCAYPLLQCYDSGRPERDAKCEPAFECSQRALCRPESTCYCNTFPFCAVADGACGKQYEDATGATTAQSVVDCLSDADCPLYWSRRLRECLRTNCPAQCYL